jgi:hypothetical protein
VQRRNRNSGGGFPISGLNPAWCCYIQNTQSSQGADDGFGVFLEDAQEGLGGASRPPAALLPVLESALADADHFSELRLRDIDGLPERQHWPDCILYGR